MNYNKKPTMEPPRKKYTTIFSDDEEDEAPPSSPWAVIPLLRPHRTSFPPRFIDPLQTSPSYHVHQAEMALFNLKSAVLYDDQDSDSGWKKVLAHKKSGVIIRMKSPPSSSSVSSDNKAPMFKGEVIFEGFTPHSIFYVIGMRKLWDQNYEDGNLVENLNETTSLTYEVCKQTSSTKSRRDLCLVEKIECTQNGTILFACTSVETPKVPRLQHRVRAQVKLMGWVLEPISSGSMPLTKVTFVIQEPVKGWMSGLTKKSMARRPLVVISSVHNYLKAKSERQVAQQDWCSAMKKRPSLSMMGASPSFQSCRKNSSSSLFHSQQTLTTQTSIPTTNCINNKHITFATGVTASPSPSPPPPDVTDTPHSILTSGVNKPATFDDEAQRAITPSYSIKAPILQHLYSPHQYSKARNESIKLLKQLYLTMDDWRLESATQASTTYTKEYQGITYSRLDGCIQGEWTPEQICSFIHSVHVRKKWDECWQQGRIVERLSQKDYLMHWKLAGNITKDGAPQDMVVTTHIDSEHGGSRIFMASKSVIDGQVPKQDGYTRKTVVLYGWVFTIKPLSAISNISNTHSKGEPTAMSPELQVSFIVDSSLPWAQKTIGRSHHQQQHQKQHQSIEQPPLPPTPPPFYSTQLACLTNVQSYLSNQGCPPYIRRVSGKIIMEHFDNDVYQVSWIAKHYPPPSCRQNSSSESVSSSSSWYTDIRLDHFMYHQGYDVDITPTQGTRIDIKSNQKTIKVFTTDASMEGTTIHIKITHRSNTSQMMPSGSVAAIAAAAATTTKSWTEPRKSQSLQNIGHKRIDSSPAFDSTYEFSPSNVVVPSRKIPTNTNGTTNSNNKRSSVAQISRCGSSSTNGHNHHHHHHHDSHHPTTLHIPKGYMLIPQPNQNQHLLNLTDDLTFNGQQLVMMLFGMVMSYYMGKLACSC